MSSVLLLAEQLRRRVPGGIGTYIRGVVTGLGRLAAAGESVPEVTLYASRPPGGPDPLDDLGLPARVSPLPGPILTRAWDSGFIGAPRGFEVVHASSLAAPPAGGRPLIVTVHDLAWRHTPAAYPRRGRRWHEAALRRAVRRATAVVVPSASVGAEVAAAGVSSSAVWVVPHGSDHLPPADEAGADILLRSLGVDDGYLLSVGTLEPRKNLARLLEAYAMARRALPEPWPLLVVGPAGWGDDAIGRLAGDGVVPVGAVDAGTLAALYRRARLLVYVPLLEGFGLPVLEAMAAGTPVVASAVPSTGGAAWEVDPLDVEAMAAAISVVATDDAARHRLCASGHAHAAAHTWAESARAHVRLWRSLS